MQSRLLREFTSARWPLELFQFIDPQLDSFSLEVRFVSVVHTLLIRLRYFYRSKCSKVSASMFIGVETNHVGSLKEGQEMHQ